MRPAGSARRLERARPRARRRPAPRTRSRAAWHRRGSPSTTVKRIARSSVATSSADARPALTRPSRRRRRSRRRKEGRRPCELVGDPVGEELRLAASRAPRARARRRRSRRSLRRPSRTSSPTRRPRACPDRPRRRAPRRDDGRDDDPLAVLAPALDLWQDLFHAACLLSMPASTPASSSRLAEIMSGHEPVNVRKRGSHPSGERLVLRDCPSTGSPRRPRTPHVQAGPSPARRGPDPRAPSRPTRSRQPHHG